MTRATVQNLEVRIAAEIQQSIDVKKRLLEGMTGLIAQMAETIYRSLSAGNKLVLFGNGGSAADAQHIAAELVGRYQCERRALSAIALSTDSSVLSAVANDYGYDEIFARQVEALGRRGDVALAISTSGNSPNVIKALDAAQKVGIGSMGLSGRSGGQMRGLVDLCLCVPSDVTARVQEAHILVGHILCGIVEESFVSSDGVAASKS